MFTKVQRFFIFFVLAFACLMLVACGEEPADPVLVAPTELAVEVYFAPIEPNATSVNGDDIELEVSVAEGCDPSVTWASSDEKIATVSDQGVVTPVAIGNVTITATSTKAPSVSASIDLVVQPENIANLLKEASDYVKANLDGKYIDGTLEKTKLPAQFQANVLTYSYKVVKTNEVCKKNYYYPTEEWQSSQIDAVDTLKCTITYNETGASTEILVTIYVVKDVEENDFNTVFAARDAIEAIFAKQNVSAYEVEQLSLAIEKSNLVAIQWSTSNSNVLKVSQVTGADTTSKTDDEFKVEYIKPMDNTDVTLTATILSAGNYGETLPIVITAKGYSNEDKVNYFKNEICANMPTEEVAIRKNIVLPGYDEKFGMQISWSSNHEELLSAQGVYTDAGGDSNVGTKVTLTATLLYLAGSEESDGTTPFTNPASFKQTVDFVVTVYPCTESAKAANLVAKYVNEHVAGGQAWFPWGKIDRADNKLAGLPATMGAAGVTGDWANVALTWKCSEEGLFDSEWNLLKQYLRYHVVTISADVVLGDVTETIEYKLNVGIAQKEMTSHIGGSFSRLATQTSDALLLTMDSLHCLSAFDDAVGTQQDWYKGDDKTQYYFQPLKVGTNEAGDKVCEIYQPVDGVHVAGKVTFNMQTAVGINCGFGGVTIYWDDPDTGVRFQFYTTEAMTWVLTEEDVDPETHELVGSWYGDEEKRPDNDGDGVKEGCVYSMLDRYQQNWDHIVIINMSGIDVHIPMVYGSSGYVNSRYSNPQTGVIGQYPTFGSASMASEGPDEISLSWYASEAVGIVRADGKVGCIDAESKWNDFLMSMSSGDGEGNYCEYLTLEPGAIAWSSGEAQDAGYTTSNKKGTSGEDANKEYVATMFATAGNQLTVEFWNIHPCNTYTTSVEWQKDDSSFRGRSELTTNVYFWARTLGDSYNVNQAWKDAAAAELAN